MNNKNVKIILFASLIATLILPFSGMDFAEAEVKQQTDKIPEDKLIPRTDEWKSKYKSDSEYEISNAEFISYVTRDLPDNKWNKAMVKEHIKIRNFETIIGDREVGLEIVALSVQKQKLQDKYDESQPVQKYHDWLLTQYSVPDNESDIDERLLDILGDKKFNKITKQLVKSYNNMAEHGSVPIELTEQDTMYWGQVTSIAICDYELSCDGDAKREHLGINSQVTDEQWDAFKEFEKNNGINPETGEPYECIFIQCAYAAQWVKISLQHTVYAKIRPALCDNGSGSSCEYITSWTGTGAKNLSTGGGQNHARSNSVLIQIYSDTTDSAGVNEIEADVTIGGATVTYGPAIAFDKAQIYQWYVQGSCGGGTPPQCGTFSISASSPDAYKWVYQ